MHTNWRAVTHGSTWRKCLQIGVDDADEEGINAKARREEESPRRGKDGTGLPTDHTDNTDEEGINAKARRGMRAHEEHEEGKMEQDCPRITQITRMKRGLTQRRGGRRKEASGDGRRTEELRGKGRFEPQIARRGRMKRRVTQRRGGRREPTKSTKRERWNRIAHGSRR